MITFIELVPFWDTNQNFEAELKEFKEANEFAFPPEREYLRERAVEIGTFPFVNVYPNENVIINSEYYVVNRLDYKTFNLGEFNQKVYVYKKP